MAKRKRKRVSREKVKENAAQGSRGGSDWFDLPEGVGRWSPDKAGRYNLDILPYEVQSKQHPDDIEPECLWYKYPFQVHHGLGAASNSLVCPRSINLPCPVCEERDKLYKEDSDKYEDVIKDLRPQKFVAYNILDPEDSDKVCVFTMSRGKFAKTLENELKDPDNEEHLAFFDVNKDGRTMRVRFSDAAFEGRKYIECTKIDFRHREEMDEDEILDKVVCLEKVLIVPPYDKLKAIFLQEEPEEEPEDPDDDEEPEEEPEDQDDEEEDDDLDPDDDDDDDEEEPEEPDDDEEEEPEDTPELKKGDRVITAEFGLDFPGTVATVFKNGKIKVEFDDGDKDSFPSEEVTLLDADDDPEAEEEPEEEPADPPCKACGGSGKNSKGGTCKPCGGTGEPKSKSKKSDTPECPAPGGSFGEVDQYDECDDCPHWNECEAVSA